MSSTSTATTKIIIKVLELKDGDYVEFLFRRHPFFTDKDHCKKSNCKANNCKKPAPFQEEERVFGTFVRWYMGDQAVIRFAIASRINNEGKEEVYQFAKLPVMQTDIVAFKIQ